jgi:hypothetical protein
MPRFTDDVFPDACFPLVATTGPAAHARRVRGLARMARSRVAFAGLARNLGPILPLTIRRLERLAALFADSRTFIFENDSVDDTKAILRSWAASNPRVSITSDDRRDPRNPTSRCLQRIERMARYRRVCQEHVVGSCEDFDVTILLDLDIQGGFSIDGIADTFGHDGWDFVGSNGLIFRRQGLRFNAVRQYDMWALRFDRAMTPLRTAEAHRHFFQVGDPLVPVTSCFGGLGVYTMEAFRAGRYGATDCEHVVFHRSLIDQGFHRLFLNPSQLVIYGRRHRFGDSIMRRLLGAAGAVTGHEPVAWEFAALPADRPAA